MEDGEQQVEEMGGGQLALDGGQLALDGGLLLVEEVGGLPLLLDELEYVPLLIALADFSGSIEEAYDGGSVGILLADASVVVWRESA